jgi:hypothetical protein
MSGTLFLTGDETGLLKAVNYHDKVVETFGEQQSRNLSIIGLSRTFENDKIALLRKNGLLEYWKFNVSEGIQFDQDLSIQLETENLVDMIPVFDSSSSISSLLTYSADGNLTLVNSSVQEGSTSDNLTTFSVPGPLSAASCCLNGGLVVGGKENDVKFYDLSTQQCLWEGRNVPHDKLKLRVPVWITSLDFISPLSSHSFSSSDSASSSCSTKFISGTGHKHVRLYDTQANRQPVKSIDIEGDYRVSVVKSSLDGMGFYVADTGGNLYYYDIRNYRRLNNMKCFQGSVRSLSIGSTSFSSSNNSAVLAGVSLDRTFKAYSCNKNKLLSSLYLKNRLNCCLALNDVLTSKNKKVRRFADDSDEENEDGDDDDDNNNDEDSNNGDVDRNPEEDNDALDQIEFEHEEDIADEDDDEDFGIDDAANSEDDEKVVVNGSNNNEEVSSVEAEKPKGKKQHKKRKYN